MVSYILQPFISAVTWNTTVMPVTKLDFVSTPHSQDHTALSLALHKKKYIWSSLEEPKNKTQSKVKPNRPFLEIWKVY